MLLKLVPDPSRIGIRAHYRQVGPHGPSGAPGDDRARLLVVLGLVPRF
jgi:hypothetical protein